jgi:hypothetical protein
MTTEFELIERFLKPFARRGAGLVVGPGDDCAVVRASPGCELCITTDALVEGVHFRSEHFSPADIGYKALAVNLSDLAAMGAEPRWFFCSISCRPADASRMSRIARGMASLAARTGIVLAGGNFSRADALSLHLTAVGEVPVGKALRHRHRRRRRAGAGRAEHRAGAGRPPVPSHPPAGRGAHRARLRPRRHRHLRRARPGPRPRRRRQRVRRAHRRPAGPGFPDLPRHERQPGPRPHRRRGLRARPLRSAGQGPRLRGRLPQGR